MSRSSAWWDIVENQCGNHSREGPAVFPPLSSALTTLDLLLYEVVASSSREGCGRWGRALNRKLVLVPAELRIIAPLFPQAASVSPATAGGGAPSTCSVEGVFLISSPFISCAEAFSLKQGPCVQFRLAGAWVQRCPGRDREGGKNGQDMSQLHLGWLVMWGGWQNVRERQVVFVFWNGLQTRCVWLFYFFSRWNRRLFIYLCGVKISRTHCQQLARRDGWGFQRESDRADQISDPTRISTIRRSWSRYPLSPL
jgi:hypothetical protein